MKIRFIFLILLSVLVCCAFDTPELTVITYNSFAAGEDVIQTFEQENGVKLRFIAVGDGGELTARAVLTRDNPIGDVIIGFDDTQLEKMLEYDVLLPYDSPELENIPEEFRSDPENRAIPFDFGDVCINYDKAWFENAGLSLPASLDDLLLPEYYGLLVTQDPGSSNTGIAFLLATVAAYGEDGFIDYWKQLVENGLKIGGGWSDTYYTDFSAAAGNGDRPMIVSYATSPAAEALYSETGEAPSASLDKAGMCYRAPEYCGILKNSANTELAEKFIDTLIGRSWQEDLPLQMFVYPVNETAELPEVFDLYGKPAEAPYRLDPFYAAENRLNWVSLWSGEVLSIY